MRHTGLGRFWWSLLSLLPGWLDLGECGCSIGLQLSNINNMYPLIGGNRLVTESRDHHSEKLAVLLVLFAAHVALVRLGLRRRLG